jgi:hypothetical protein
MKPTNEDKETIKEITSQEGDGIGEQNENGNKPLIFRIKFNKKALLLKQYPESNQSPDEMLKVREKKLAIQRDGKKGDSHHNEDIKDKEKTIED